METRFKKWLKANGVSFRQAQRLTKVDYTTIFKVANPPKAEYQPKFATLRRLEKLTEGKVTMLDMLNDIKEIQDARI